MRQERTTMSPNEAAQCAEGSFAACVRRSTGRLSNREHQQRDENARHSSDEKRRLPWPNHTEHRHMPRLLDARELRDPPAQVVADAGTDKDSQLVDAHRTPQPL